MSELIATTSGEIRARDALLGYWWFEKSEVDATIAELKAKADKLHSCLKCLVMRDLIKDCPEKESAIEIIKEFYK